MEKENKNIMTPKQFYNNQRYKLIALTDTHEGIKLEIKTARFEGSLSIILSREDAFKLAKEIIASVTKQH